MMSKENQQTQDLNTKQFLNPYVPNDVFTQALDQIEPKPKKKKREHRHRLQKQISNEQQELIHPRTSNEFHNKLVKDKNRPFTKHIVKMFVDDTYEESEESQSELDISPEDKGDLISIPLQLGE